jgi:hypothetical protein
MRDRIRRGRWPALVLLLAAPGCGSDGLDSPTAARLKALANFYLDYAVSQHGRGPADEQALKKHLRIQPDFLLKTNGIDPSAVDSLFSSERDGEPFVILYGVQISRISGTSAPLVAHEKTGKNGKRLAVCANGKVELADEARLKELSPAKQ